jgi:superfamily II DNA or RNA helicase
MPDARARGTRDPRAKIGDPPVVRPVVRSQENDDGMARSVRLRPWQKEALEKFHARDRPDFLAVATPGAGKTTFALAAAAQHLSRNPQHRLVVVAPTQHLKHQWARAAGRLDLHLEPQWSARDGQLPADMHGIVVTYQQVASQARALRAMSTDAFVVFDELHHAGDDRAWGDGTRLAFGQAAARLALSGTPFRSDTTAIPFVEYDDFGLASADYEYGYGEALHDRGVVRPVYFPRIDGHMEWVGPDGEQYSHTFEDPLDRARSGQRLRTALSLSGEWLPAVIDQAHAQLLAIREVHHHAGGLVIAMDHEHARGIVHLLKRRHGVTATLALSDDPTASSRIEHFAEGSQPWIVAVRMVSEGVDIPRLRVGVFATNTSTELFFRQAVGRLVRWTRGMRHQKAFCFIPDDPRLRTYAAGLAEQRRHSLRRRETEDDELPDGALDELAVTAPEDEQLSLFAAISAVALGDPHTPEWLSEDGEDNEDDVGLVDEGSDPDDGLTIALSPPPRPGATIVDSRAVAATSTGAPVVHRTRREHKAHLRKENADWAREIVRLSGLSHPQVNRELNRLSGIRAISEATVEQLDNRLRQAERWLRRL